MRKAIGRYCGSEVTPRYAHMALESAGAQSTGKKNSAGVGSLAPRQERAPAATHTMIEFSNFLRPVDKPTINFEELTDRTWIGKAED